MSDLQEYDLVLPDSSDAPRAESPHRFAVDVRRFPWIRRLAGDYAHDFARLAQWYSGDPSAPDAWSAAIRRARALPRERRVVAAAVAAQLERRGAPAEARAAAARLHDPETVAVITGQQAGLFGGPLFTVLKTLTALQLANRVWKENGVPVVTVFWVDAEDHDWDEVRHSTVLDAEFVPREITLGALSGAGERPIGGLRLDEQIDTAIDDLRAALPPTEFTAPLIDSLRSCYRPGIGMADAFARWLENILGNRGLVVFDASDPAAKAAARTVFVRELSSAGLSGSLAAMAGSELSKIGHSPQVMPSSDVTSLFHLDGVRRPIRRLDDGFAVDEIRYSRDVLVAEASTQPERFSPNVLLRPIVQDTLFPTICYVAGPSELAYLGQLRRVYEAFDVPMPLVHPRASATILDAGGMRFLARYQMPLEDLQPQDERALNRLLEAQLPAAVDRSLREASDAIRGGMRKVVDAMPALDATLAGAARTTLGRMEHDLEGLRNKVVQAAKRRDETLRRQFMRTRAQAFPQGQPQERTLGVTYFLNRYGPGLIDRLLSELPLDSQHHWVLTV